MFAVSAGRGTVYGPAPMLDIKLLREDPERIAKNLEDRYVRPMPDLPESGYGAVVVARIAELDDAYRALLAEAEGLRHQQKENSAAMKAVGKLPKDEQAAARAPLIEEGRALRDRERETTEKAEQAREARDAAWSHVPNLTHDDTPRGGEAAKRELRIVGQPRDFAAEGFEPQDHLAIAEALDLVDFAAGAKVAGQKFYFLKNEAVLLDLALQHYAIDVARRHGFTLHTTPDLARVEILEGLGFAPRGESTQVYSVADSDLCLVGTAEITLGGMLADTIVDVESLPILSCGLSHCFRTEAGSHGQESRGLYRVHQFTKVELFAFTEGDLGVSQVMHDRLLAIEEEIFSGLGIPFRVVDIASGDLGGQALRKYDLEAWMPGRGGWGEITSTSNCTDYQARRLKIRYRPESDDGGKSKPRLVHTLNGTAVATSRALVALLENGQQADGSVKLPKSLERFGAPSVIGPR